MLKTTFISLNVHYGERPYKLSLTHFVVVSVALMLAGCGGAGSGASDSSSGTFPATTGTGTATLTWEQPTTNTDGTQLQLGGFVIYRGNAECCLHPVGTVAANATSHTVGSLPPGTHYFAVTAIDAIGVESVYSNVVSKLIN